VNDIVGRIVDVKELRVERAEEAVQAARLALEEAGRRVVERERELEEYRVWRRRKEEALFDELQTKLVSVREIEDVKVEIGLLRGRETLFEQKITDAKAERAKAHEALDASTRAYEAAVKNLQKFEELADWLDAEAKAYRERMEELELEEQLAMASVDREEALA
jgi:type III secretion protein O